MATLIDGIKIANELNNETNKSVEKLKKKGICPGLAVIVVGDNPVNLLYVSIKQRKAKQLGIYFVEKHLSANISKTEFLMEIQQLNFDASIHGILVQVPLPKHLNELDIARTILPEKDVDGVHPFNVGLLNTKNTLWYPVSCTPKGIMKMLEVYNVPLTGKHAVVVGRSNIVGRPMASLLIQDDVTVTIANRHTENIKYLTSQADILIVATGVAHLITSENVRNGATVIDAGMDRDENGIITGDVDFNGVSQVAGKITPVPGGVGPMTIAMLMQQTVELAKRSDNCGK